MNALIVEDEFPLADVYASLLRSIGFNVQITDSIEEASKIIITGDAMDVITLDLNLRDSAAPATIEHIKEIRRKNPTALLVVVSGVLTPADSARAIELGADGAIEKMDAASEKGFWAKLGDVIATVFGNPSSRINRNAPLLEAMAVKVAQKLNFQGKSLGGAISEKQEIID